MRKKRIALGGALLAGLTAALVMIPKFGNKARRAVRRAAGITHRSGVSTPGARTKADPARAKPA